MDDAQADERRFLRRVLIVAGVVALALFLWMARQAVLIGFGAVVVGVILDGLAGLVMRQVGCRRRWALLAAALGLLLLVALAGLLIGAQLASQVKELAQALPQAVSSLEQRFGIEIPDRPGELPGGLLGSVADFGAAVAGALSGLVLAVVAGTFLAASPETYREGFVKLFPRDQGARVRDMLDTVGNALRRWLLATLVAMAIIGVAAGLAAWFIGLPAPLALGLFAGLAQFVPVIGSVLGAVPALLLAASLGSGAVLWTAAAFLLIQQVESNMITPVVEERLVNIPAFVLLLGIVAIGGVFGLAGVVLAAPITVTAFVAVQKLYVRQTLGRNVEVSGEAG